jgi:hypothetical protein
MGYTWQKGPSFRGSGWTHKLDQPKETGVQPVQYLPPPTADVTVNRWAARNRLKAPPLPTEAAPTLTEHCADIESEDEKVPVAKASKLPPASATGFGNDHWYQSPVNPKVGCVSGPWHHSE